MKTLHYLGTRHHESDKNRLVNRIFFSKCTLFSLNTPLSSSKHGVANYYNEKYHEQEPMNTFKSPVSSFEYHSAIVTKLNTFKRRPVMKRNGFIRECNNFEAKDLLTYWLFFVHIEWIKAAQHCHCKCEYVQCSHKTNATFFMKNSIYSYLHPSSIPLLYAKWVLYLSLAINSQKMHMCKKGMGL